MEIINIVRNDADIMLDARIPIYLDDANKVRLYRTLDIKLHFKKYQTDFILDKQAANLIIKAFLLTLKFVKINDVKILNKYYETVGANSYSAILISSDISDIRESVLRSLLD